MAFDYTLDWTDSSYKPSFTLPGKTVDTTSTSLALTGKGTIGWGKHFEENFLHLLENFASNGTPPANATPGQLWFNASSNTLNIQTDSGFVDVLSSAYTGVTTIDPTPIQNAITALKPRVIRTTYLGSGWYDWWGGTNMANFNGQIPSKPGLANSWIPVTNSICNANGASIAYVSSVANKLVTTFKIDRPARVGISLNFTGSLSPAPSLYSINFSFVLEQSFDNGVTWVMGAPLSSQVLAHVKNSAGTTIAFTSIVLKNEINANGMIYRTLGMIVPSLTPPDSGLTGHLINSSGVDQGAFMIDEDPLIANVNHRITVYVTVGVMDNTVTLRQLSCNCRFFLIGE